MASMNTCGTQAATITSMRAMSPSGIPILPFVANHVPTANRFRYRDPADNTWDDRETSATFDRFSEKT
jgi:hypothetical protein